MKPLRNLQQLTNAVIQRFTRYAGEDCELPQYFKDNVKEINSNTITYNKYSAIILTKGYQNGALSIYMPNQWFYIASYFTDLYQELIKYKGLALSIASKERLKVLNGNNFIADELDALNRLDIDESSKEYLKKFITDYSWWGGAKTIDRGDFYVSPILNDAKLVNASQTFVADLCAFLSDKPELVQSLLNKDEKNFILCDKKETQPLQRIFYGAPGTGKSHTIKEMVKGEDVIRTTFHPDSDYSTFVGCYKPTTKIVRMRDMAGHVIIENNEEVTEDRIVYEFVSQAFLQAYVAAWKKLGEAQGGEAKRQFLVIEEINRGNCAQVFGDLFQLLDRNDYGFSEYSIKADADIKKYLQKAFAGLEIADKEQIDRLYDKRVVNQVVNGDILLLPNNLYVWATMNTSDQSLFPIDSAFKRRWDWQYVPICNAGKDWIIEVGENQYGWWQFLEKINALIGTTTNSEDKKLGYFFCKAKAGIISAEIFVSKVIFYLWNDVFKNYELSDAFFKDADNSILTFDKFYGIDESGKTIVQEDKVKMFLANLKVDIISKSANEEVNGEMTESEA